MIKERLHEKAMVSADNLAENAPPVVRLEGLCKAFEEGGRQRLVLDKVDYQFDRGQFVVLLGHSGSGKSTLLNLISGIDRPSAGHISVLGTRITALNERDRTLFRRDHIGFVFQFFNLIPTLTVLENITLPQELAGRPRRALEPAAMHLLDRVGLADRRDARRGGRGGCWTWIVFSGAVGQWGRPETEH